MAQPTQVWHDSTLQAALVWDSTLRQFLCKLRDSRRNSDDAWRHQDAAILATYADQLTQKLNDWTRSLMVAIGATLLACISGLGSAWKYPELHRPFLWLIQWACMGLGVAFVINAYSLKVVQTIVVFQRDHRKDPAGEQMVRSLRSMRFHVAACCLMVAAAAILFFVFGGWHATTMIVGAAIAHPAISPM